jgi:hypothetical protein
VLLREIMQLSGLRRFLADRLQAPRRQAAIWYPLADLVTGAAAARFRAGFDRIS